MEVESPAQTQRRAQLPSGHRNLRLIVSILLTVVGATSSPLLLRTYYLHGGNRKWLSSLLQSAGWPLLLAPLCASFISRRRCSATTPVFLMSPRLLATSVVLGLMTGLDGLLYAYGMAYLPVTTSSILSSTELAFTSVFALLFVRQRFTAFSVNAVLLLSVSAAMLGMNAGGDRPAGVSRVQYSAGFAMKLGAAALYGLMMPVMELSRARHAARTGCAVTYTLVMEMQVVMGIIATAFSAVGMLVSNDFQAISGEAREFGLGKAGYYLVLAGFATGYQFFFLGTMGATFYGSALLAGVILAVLIPVTEVLAVIFLHEPFNGIKGIALALSVWGFVSYFYGEIRNNAQQSDKPPNADQSDPY